MSYTAHILLLFFYLLVACSPSSNQSLGDVDLLDWYRPIDQPIFTDEYGNNHDPILFYDETMEYPYYLIISHEKTAAHLWRAKEWSVQGKDWELVSDQYQIGGHYEYDDGLKIDGMYYLYEAGKVYTFTGALEDGSGQWEESGSFPVEECDDIGVYYEDGVFHIFGEFGYFPHGPDGSSLSHFQSTTGLGDWKLVDSLAVNPNPDGGQEIGVGDATIVKVDSTYYLYCDQETEDLPYRIAAWKTNDLQKSFEFLKVVIEPRSEDVEDWDNYRIQDGDVEFIPEIGKYVMMVNMKDHDGQPGYPQGKERKSSHLKDGQTRVVGMFYADPLD